jgi:hypothetical protein
MATRSVVWNRFATFAGLCCLAFSLLLMPVGVRAVRADDARENAKAKTRSSEAEKSDQARETVVAPEPGVRVLNNRGYNYGRPPAGRPSPPEPADESK